VACYRCQSCSIKAASQLLDESALWLQVDIVRGWQEIERWISLAGLSRTESSNSGEWAAASWQSVRAEAPIVREFESDDEILIITSELGELPLHAYLNDFTA
jgi:hypothetical protein